MIITIIHPQMERWWKELHERLEKYFKHQLRWLNDHGHYDANCDTDRFVNCIECNVYFQWVSSIRFLAQYTAESANKFHSFLNLYRMLLAYIMIPVIQKELDVFKDTIWNTHRIRAQKDTCLPCGIPNHIYAFPQEYNLEECGKLFSNFNISIFSRMKTQVNLPGNLVSCRAAPILTQNFMQFQAMPVDWFVCHTIIIYQKLYGCLH